MAEHVIELKGISKTINGEEILHNIDLQVRNGEFLTLLGPSGCGKTTLLRLISGFEEPTEGRVFIGDKDVSGLPPHERHVHTVFQNYALFPHMSVFENVAFGLRCQKLPEAEIAKRVAEALNMVKLGTFANRKPDQLSGGQQQRVAIARAVVNRPLVLLLDEPLSSLDYRLRKTMQIELKQLQRKLGITFIFVTHDQEEALSMSDRVVIMEKGHIEQVGTPRQVYEEPYNLTVYWRGQHF
jgi:spermidine/putrescine transport system ATP-binding protein